MTGHNTDDLKHYTVVSLFYNKDETGPDEAHCDVTMGHDPHPYISRINCASYIEEQGGRSQFVIEFNVDYRPEGSPQ